jgi:universal stress protein A
MIPSQHTSAAPLALWRRVLVPMDFSPPSKAALVYALTLARASGATVHVCHLIPRPGVLDLFYEHDFEPPESAKRAGQKVRRIVKDLVASTPTGGTGVTVRTHCSEGDAAPGVLEWVAKLKPDLIVMGTHGRRGARRFFMGSVAEAVLRRTVCPVLILRESAS